MEEFTREEKSVAHTIFRNRVLELEGTPFENFFCDILGKRYPEFRKIKPQGNIGDRANDGYIPSLGRYFQVFAPEEPKFKINDAITKAQKDFARLKSEWEDTTPVKEFFFVFNDKFKGEYPTVSEAVTKIGNDNKLDNAATFTMADLQREFLELSFDHVQQVLHSPIPRTIYIANIDSDSLTRVLQHLISNQIPLDRETSLIVPNFDDKIRFNRIGDTVGSLLKNGNFQNQAVESYFISHGEFEKVEIQEALASLYAKYISDPDYAEDGDSIFWDLVSKISPSNDRQIQESAIVLIAYFFEKCDVFEEPKNS